MKIVHLITLAGLVFGAPVHAQNATPADLYGQLFVDVQTQRLFPDSKTFVDAVPNRPPSDIVAAYQSAQNSTREDLRAFVSSNFDLPKDQAVPLPVETRQSLKAHIKSLWPHLERSAPVPPEGSSALALPAPYVVPGGRFRELYYWDSYFTLLGLYADGQDAMAQNMLLNFESLIERYGHVPNGTRTYYLSRSQPPVFALMLEIKPSIDPSVQAREIAALRREHDYWMAGTSCAVKFKPCQRVVRMPDGSLLNRYWDDRDTPREESFAEDVETAAKSKREPAIVYRDLRAAAESGWDFSSRWLKDPADLSSIRTTQIVPIDLNSLLWKMERVIADRCEALQQLACSDAYGRMARERKKTINRYLWRPAQQRFADYNIETGRATLITSAAMLFPLFVGMADQTQADATARLTRLQLTASGGVRTTQNPSGQQWDSPNGWPPLQWVAISGLDAYGHHDQARDLARRFIRTVDKTYRETGKMLEKYDIEQSRPGGGGEYPLQDGFGWTNGVTRALLERYPDLEPAS
jgi:alpha,alpha-trehalase